MLQSLGFMQIITEPTRITSHSATLLDVICVTKDVEILESGVQDMENISDHRLVHCKLNVEVYKRPPTTFYVRDYNMFMSNEFQFDANSVNWMNVDMLDNIQDKIKFLNDAITILFDIHAPLKLVKPKIRKYRPYITEAIKDMIKLKRKAYQKYKASGLENHRSYYKELCNIINEAIKREKIAYMKHRIKTTNKRPQELWQVLNKFNVHKKKPKTIDDSITPEQFNRYLVEQTNNQIIDNDVISFFQRNRRPGVTTDFNLEPTTESEVENVISNIRSNAAGVDNINLKMLKIVLPYCKTALVHIINHSFITGTFPDQWKLSTVIPLPKKPNASSLVDLRPISILPILSKVIETIVKRRLTDYIKNYSIIPSIQSGFRPHHSTNTALLKIITDCVQAMDTGEVTALITLDYSKAFDRINHNLLLAKLKYYGCSDLAILWFQNYLKDRKQVVKIGNSVSGKQDITEGVPQGSVLGPTLFVLFIADIIWWRLPGLKFHFYADDTQIYTSFNLHSALLGATMINKQLMAISEWNRANGLLLNLQKCGGSIIGSTTNRNAVLHKIKKLIKIDDHILEFNDSIKSLGVYIDCELKFQNHVNSVLAKCYAKFGYLYQFKQYLDSSTKWKLCNTLMLTNFDYCSSVYYAHLTVEYKNKIQVFQNTCLRYSYNLPLREHVTPLYYKLGMIKYSERIMLAITKLVYNVYKMCEPLYLVTYFVKRQYTTHLTLRNKEPYEIPYHKHEKFKCCFAYISVKILNEYDTLFRCNTRFDCVKSQIIRKSLEKYRDVH